MRRRLLVYCCVTACRFDACLYGFRDWKSFGKGSAKSQRKGGRVVKPTGAGVTVYRVEDDGDLRALGPQSFVRGRHLWPNKERRESVQRLGL